MSGVCTVCTSSVSVQGPIQLFRSIFDGLLLVASILLVWSWCGGRSRGFGHKNAWLSVGAYQLVLELMSMQQGFSVGFLIQSCMLAFLAILLFSVPCSGARYSNCQVLRSCMKGKAHSFSCSHLISSSRGQVASEISFVLGFCKETMTCQKDTRYVE